MNINYFLLSVILSLSLTVFAHERIDLQISSLDKKLSLKPNDTKTLLRRAGLHYAHGDFSSALKDSIKVKKSLLKNKKAWFIESRSLIGLKRYSEALSHANQAFKLWPNSLDIILLNARVKAKYPNKIKESLADYTKAIDLIRKPNPALLIERSKLQLSIGIKGYLPALEQLSEARSKYGFIFVTQKKALDIALKIDHLDKALKITKDICRNLNRHDKWLKIIGDIHIRQGKKDDARHYYKRALLAIESLSNRQKNHSKTVSLKNELMMLLDYSKIKSNKNIIQ